MGPTTRSKSRRAASAFKFPGSFRNPTATRESAQLRHDDRGAALGNASDANRARDDSDLIITLYVWSHYHCSSQI